MKAICEGRSSRNDVVQQNLDQYRAVFNRTTQQINVLKAVSSAHAILVLRRLLILPCAYRPSGSTLSERIKPEPVCTRRAQRSAGEAPYYRPPLWKMSCRYTPRVLRGAQVVLRGA
jgi:DNA topoisomerase-3